MADAKREGAIAEIRRFMIIIERHIRVFARGVHVFVRTWAYETVYTYPED